MTAPATPSRRQTLVAAAFVVLFAGCTVVGALVARSLLTLGILLATACLIGTVLSVGVLFAASRGRPGGQARTARVAAAVVVVAAIVLTFATGDFGLIPFSVLCAVPLLLLARFARSVDRRLERSHP